MATKREEVTPIPQPAYPPEVYYDREDEISLVDLWLVLVKRKRLIGAVLLLAILGGIAATFLMPNKYAITTMIEIGAHVQNGEIERYETQQSVLTKLKQVYIPLVLREAASSNPDRPALHQIDVQVPKKSPLIVLKSEATAEEGEEYVRLQQAVVAQLERDHADILGLHRLQLKADLADTGSQTEKLKDQADFLRLNQKTLDETAILLEAHIKEVNQAITEAGQDLENLTRSAVTKVMLKNEIRDHRMRLAELRERLYIGLPRERGRLRKDIRENHRAQNAQRSQTTILEQRLENLQGTRALVAPSRSPRTVGRSPKLMAALSVFLGLILAIFAAFIAEFLSNAREKVRSEVTAGTGT